ncbi:MAG TPA: biopolymer transporter ExbD [Verrucomicrobiae bacterium]|jgi:biopolymer transport protein ExbD|nr:biopolymer transporter ExbD [Verrucomicrobiae bacterium]
MRFVRHARIFRGPLDPAPLASVAFLLVLFMLLTSLVYTPGALIRLGGGAGTAGGEKLEITASNALIFRGVLYTNRAEAKAALQQPPIGRVNLVVDPGADRRAAQEVSGWFEVNLPEVAQWTGTENPTVIVSVNFRGQCFYQNRPVDDAELKSELQKRLQAAREKSSDLTLALEMDKDAPNNVFMRLCDLARNIGFKTALIVPRQ